MGKIKVVQGKKRGAGRGTPGGRAKKAELFCKIFIA